VTAKTVLSVLARAGTDGQPSTLTASITLQDRSVYVGPVRLATLPPIDWGAEERDE
jgi:hypothetical protein